MTPRFERLCLVLILLAAIIVRLPGFTAPFVGPHEDDNARYSLAARNHLRLGLGVTLGTNCLAVSTDDPRPSDFYVNHPGTLSLIIAVAFALFGESEAVTRTIPLLFTLAAIILLFRAVRSRWNLRHAVFAATFMALAPIAVWYGKLAVFMPLILPFGIFVADSLARHTVEGESAKGTQGATGTGEDGRQYGSGMEMAAMAAAVSIDYGAVLLVPALWIALGPRKRLIGPTLVAAGIAALLLAQVTIASGSAGLLRLAAKGIARAGAGASFSTGDFLAKQVLEYFWYGFSPLAAALMIWGAVAAFRERGDRNRFIFALGGWGLLYILVFREAAQVHDYWQYYLIPAAAMLFAIGLASLPRPVAVLLLILFLDQSGRILTRRYMNDTGWYIREFEAIAYAQAHAKRRDIVVTREPMRTAHPAWYADRRFEVDATLGESFVLKKYGGSAE